MPFPWSISITKNESSKDGGKDFMMYTCLVCYGPLSQPTCPGPGAHLPGGSSNPHGLNCAIAPIEFISPDRIKHVGSWQNYFGDTRCGYRCLGLIAFAETHFSSLNHRHIQLLVEERRMQKELLAGVELGQEANADEMDRDGKWELGITN